MAVIEESLGWGLVVVGGEWSMVNGEFKQP
jgi:hypothetical protein